MKKFTKKLVGVISALALVLGLIPVTAMAAPTWGGQATGTLTIHKTNEKGELLKGAGYTVYKVANLKQENGVLSYDSLVEGVTVTGATTASDFKNAKLPTPVGEQTSDGISDITFSDLDLGVYLVKESTTPDGVIKSNSFIVSIPMTNPETNEWNYDVTATPKNSVTTGSVKKELVSTDTNAEGEGKVSVNIGQVLDYKVTVTVPEDFYGSSEFAKAYTQYDIVDEPTIGLSIVPGSFVVKVDGAVVGLTPVLGTPANGFTLGLVNDTKDAPATVEIKPSSVVTIEYKAKITAEGMDKEIKNNIKVDYNYDGTDKPGVIDPGTPDPETPDPNPTLVTYSHGVLKTDDDKAALDGAKFILKLQDGKYIKLNETNDGWDETDNESEAYVFESGKESPLTAYNTTGYFAIYGIKGGTHELIETVSPKGYSLLKSPVEVSFDEETTTTQLDNKYTTTIVNAKDFSLPGTGGKGIILYIAMGIILLGVGALLFNKRRKLS